MCVLSVSVVRLLAEKNAFPHSIRVNDLNQTILTTRPRTAINIPTPADTRARTPYQHPHPAMQQSIDPRDPFSKLLHQSQQKAASTAPQQPNVNG